MMSIFMFVFMGVAPLTATVAGWLASILSLSTLFIGAGLGLSVAALGAWLFTPMARLSDARPAGTADAADAGSASPSPTN
jgi:hypothetical protein